MKVIISNTSPLRYLIEIQHQDILPQLFGKIAIPHIVFQELTHAHTPPRVRSFIQTVPDWLQRHDHVKPMDNSLDELDAGEREAIWLAKQLKAGLLLIDDKLGRLLAQLHGVPITGTLGILEFAAQQRLLHLPQAISKLQQTNIKISPKLFQQVLERFSRR